MDYFVHASACVDEGAKIGRGTRIWHFCHIMAGAQIGANVTLGQNTFVGQNVIVGDNCKIQNNVSIYEGVTLEEDVFCGPSMVFTNVDWPRSAYPRDSDDYLPTLVKRGSTIGANATIICGVVLGRFSFVGAGSVVTASVPDHGLVYGVPAALQGWVCACGTKLSFQGEQARCSSCGRAFRKRSPAGKSQVEEVSVERSAD